MTQLVLPLETRSAFGRADFIVAPGNRQAVAFVDSWPNWPAPGAALYGPPASGKSHLAAVWAARSGAVVLEAARLDGAIPDDPLVVENVGPGTAETPLFALLERGAPLLLTAQAPPADWPLYPSGLEIPGPTRASGLQRSGRPDDALLMGLAVKLFADRQVQVPETVVSRMIREPGAVSPSAIRDFVARAEERRRTGAEASHYL